MAIGVDGPVPLEVLLEHALGDGDYDDGIFGWVNWQFDPVTGELLIGFKRDEYDDEEIPEGEDYSSVQYRFELAKHQPAND